MILFQRIKLLLIILVFISLQCSDSSKQNSITGLWSVTEVSMGENSMTPVARWIRFNSDSTQVSGNGWLQHSYGTWKTSGEMISVNDFNGVDDESGSFSYILKDTSMTWIRSEEGQDVIVNLKRIKEIPSSGRNKLVGLWKITRAMDNGSDTTTILNPNKKGTLHLRWENSFVEQNLPKGRRSGVYRVHGHKPELQMVNFGVKPSFSFWSFEVSETKLKLLSTDKKTILEFERIHQFLN